MPSPLRNSLAALLVALITVSCGDLKRTPTDPTPPADTPDPTATLTRVQNEIFTPSCALSACHDSQTQQQQLILEPGKSFANVVNRPSTEISSLMRIRPMDPDNSYLYLKVTGSPRIIADRMPQGRTPLSEAQLKLIRDWIRRGAPND